MNETSDSTPSPPAEAPQAEARPAEAPPVKPSLVGASPVAVKPAAEAPQPRAQRVRPYRFLGATVLALLGLLAMAGIKSYRDLAAARDIENDLRREIAETRTRVRLLAEHIERVENDPATLERIAREELGMVREGDVVIVLPAEDEPPAAASSSQP